MIYFFFDRSLIESSIVKAVVNNTTKVEITIINTILKVLPFIRLKADIIPTPAGRKKKAKLSRKKLDTNSICSNLIILVNNSISKKSIPITLPGREREKDLLINSPMNVIIKIRVSSLNIFIETRTPFVVFRVLRLIERINTSKLYYKSKKIF